jgi:hypothetical protein
VNISLTVWLLTVAAVCALVAVDFFIGRKPHDVRQGSRHLDRRPGRPRLSAGSTRPTPGCSPRRWGGPRPCPTS